MRIIEAINDAQFEKKVWHSELPVLLDINSPECIICKTMDERIREIATAFKGKVNFYSLDVNKNKIWGRFEVKSVPTIIYFKAGREIHRHDVFPEKEEMTEHLNKLIGK